jgi:hypothetical protein
LTRACLRVSYRKQAFLWNPGGGGTGAKVRLLKLGIQDRIPFESLVEQEADGSWVDVRWAGAEKNSSRRTSNNRILHLLSLANG